MSVAKRVYSDGTRLSSNIQGDEIVLPANKIIRKDRPARGGGVAIIVKMSITCHIMDDLPLKDVVQS